MSPNMSPKVHGVYVYCLFNYNDYIQGLEGKILSQVGPKSNHIHPYKIEGDSERLTEEMVM